MPFTCSRCAAEVPEGIDNCHKCGQPMNGEDAIPDGPFCPACKKVYPDEYIYCLNDGQKLVRSASGQQARTTAGTAPSQYAHYTVPVPPGSTYPKANLGARFLAKLIDTAVALLAAVPSIIFFSMSGDTTSKALPLLIGFLLLVLPAYYLLTKDGWGQGQSLGKRALRLMVIEVADNTPCSKATAIKRNLVSGLCCLVPLAGYFIEPVAVLTNVQGRKVGDRAAGTLVIQAFDYAS